MIHLIPSNTKYHHAFTDWPKNIFAKNHLTKLSNLLHSELKCERERVASNQSFWLKRRRSDSISQSLVTENYWLWSTMSFNYFVPIYPTNNKISQNIFQKRFDYRLDAFESFHIEKNKMEIFVRTCEKELHFHLIFNSILRNVRVNFSFQLFFLEAVCLRIYCHIKCL